MAESERKREQSEKQMEDKIKHMVGLYFRMFLEKEAAKTGKNIIVQMSNTPFTQQIITQDKKADDSDAPME